MDLPFGETRNPKFFNIVRKKKTDKEIGRRARAIFLHVTAYDA